MLETIFEWLAEQAGELLEAVLDLFLGELDITIPQLMAFVPFFWKGYRIFQVVGISMVILLGAWQFIRFFGGNLGDLTESPLAILVRSFIAAGLIYFGGNILEVIVDLARIPYNIFMQSDAIINEGAGSLVAGTVLDMIAGLPVDAVFTATTAILSLVLILVIGWNLLKIILEIYERYIMIGVLVFSSPLIYPFLGSKSTGRVFGRWLGMFLSDCALMFITVWGLDLVLSTFTASTGNYIVMRLMIALALCKIVQKLDTYMRQLGFNSTSSAGNLLNDAVRTMADMTRIGSAVSGYGRTGSAGTGKSAVLGSDGDGRLSRAGGIFGGIQNAVRKGTDPERGGGLGNLRENIYEGMGVSRETLEKHDGSGPVSAAVRAREEGKSVNEAVKTGFSAAKDRITASTVMAGQIITNGKAFGGSAPTPSKSVSQGQGREKSPAGNGKTAYSHSSASPDGETGGEKSGSEEFSGVRDRENSEKDVQSQGGNSSGEEAFGMEGPAGAEDIRDKAGAEETRSGSEREKISENEPEAVETEDQEYPPEDVYGESSSLQNPESGEASEDAGYEAVQGYEPGLTEENDVSRTVSDEDSAEGETADETGGEVYAPETGIYDGGTERPAEDKDMENEAGLEAFSSEQERVSGGGTERDFSENPDQDTAENAGDFIPKGENAQYGRETGSAGTAAVSGEIENEGKDENVGTVEYDNISGEPRESGETVRGEKLTEDAARGETGSSSGEESEKGEPSHAAETGSEKSGGPDGEVSGAEYKGRETVKTYGEAEGGEKDSGYPGQTEAGGENNISYGEAEPDTAVYSGLNGENREPRGNGDGGETLPPEEEERERAEAGDVDPQGMSSDNLREGEAAEGTETADEKPYSGRYVPDEEKSGDDDRMTRDTGGAGYEERYSSALEEKAGPGENEGYGEIRSESGKKTGNGEKPEDGDERVGKDETGTSPERVPETGREDFRGPENPEAVGEEKIPTGNTAMSYETFPSGERAPEGNAERGVKSPDNGGDVNVSGEKTVPGESAKLYDGGKPGETPDAAEGKNPGNEAVKVSAGGETVERDEAVSPEREDAPSVEGKNNEGGRRSLRAVKSAPGGKEEKASGTDRSGESGDAKPAEEEAAAPETEKRAERAETEESGNKKTSQDGQGPVNGAGSESVSSKKDRSVTAKISARRPADGERVSEASKSSFGKRVRGRTGTRKRVSAVQGKGGRPSRRGPEETSAPGRTDKRSGRNFAGRKKKSAVPPEEGRRKDNGKGE